MTRTKINGEIIDLEMIKSKIMRTIKFRGKNKETGKWEYGDLVQCMNDDIKIVNSNQPKDMSFRIIDIQPNTLGQFTGLVDKNGNEIYEGDVIQGDYNYRHLIQYDEQDACFVACLLPITKFSSRGNVRQNWIDEFDKVVIGNIHDNPELMKGE